MTMLHRLGCALVAAVAFTALPALAQEKKPNVVFILADNVGYGDLDPYGRGELRGAPTPRIDQLAREGLRLTQYLVEPGCTPSRAALMTTDRPIDGVDQTDVLFGKSETGNRDGLLTFIGADMVAARWKQWRMYFTDVHPTGIGPQRQPGMFSASAPMAGYPKRFNIEMDPHENLEVAALFGWTMGPMLEIVAKYKDTLKKYPNPPAGNLTKF